MCLQTRKSKFKYNETWTANAAISHINTFPKTHLYKSFDIFHHKNCNVVESCIKHNMYIVCGCSIWGKTEVLFSLSIGKLR